MKSESRSLNKHDITNFWIKVYFGTTAPNKILDAVIDRAYRDFNRTMHGLGEFQTKDKYNSLKQVLRNIVLEMDSCIFLNQAQFDEWHKLKCDEIISSFSCIPYTLYYGQAQKWLNMTLKYLTAINFESDNLFKVNYHYFHVPIDKIIQDQFQKFGIPKLKLNWSRIDNYNVYFDYQLKIRAKFTPRIPLDVEFELFNGS